MVLERPRHHVTVGAARVAEACASRVTTREGRDTVLSSFSFPLPFVVLDCVGSMAGRDAHCDRRVEATCNLRFPSRESFLATHSVDAEGTTNHLFEMRYPWFFLCWRFCLRLPSLLCACVFCDTRFQMWWVSLRPVSHSLRKAAMANNSRSTASVVLLTMFLDDMEIWDSAHNSLAL